ncbi:lactoylglutathione lyase [Ectopseudomonas mendocina]|uniref:Lactoylglutathione lyase n=1 Tax=Ectopseudomonas mendocina TaxID=300 RepID=A0ABZ2RNI7_ECTME
MRILHTMLRVTDLTASIDFYTQALGMRLLRRKDYPEGRFTLAFVGYQDESLEAALELTFNWDTDHYELGNGYGHIAVEVEDAAQVCAHAKSLGYQVTREAGVMKHGKTVIAFLQDPNGYKVELIQKGTQQD